MRVGEVSGRKGDIILHSFKQALRGWRHFALAYLMSLAALGSGKEWWDGTSAKVFLITCPWDPWAQVPVLSQLLRCFTTYFVRKYMDTIQRLYISRNLYINI